MVQLTTPEAIAKATERAKATRLFVKPTNLFRQYQVENRSNGQTYTVDFFIRNGKRFGHCTCKGGMAGFACKHLSAAAALHTCLAAQKRDS
jgi:uncharacterized Zn finger protein